MKYTPPQVDTNTLNPLHPRIKLKKGLRGVPGQAR